LPFQRHEIQIKKVMKNLKFLLMAFIILSAISCSKDENKYYYPVAQLTETKVQMDGHYITAFSYIRNTKYLVVFESGLGDNHQPWTESDIALNTGLNSDILLYDRAGYGKSPFVNNTRNINQLRSELENVIDHFANGRKVILVGHSLGGPIIRDYAIKNPSKTAALLFVDASHEMYNQLTQEQEDYVYNLHNELYGPNFGGTLEARELIEDMDYMSTLPNLPDVPIICLTSMRIDAEHDAADRQLWYDSKEALKAGISDFTHVTTVNSGHYIMLEEPNLVMAQINELLRKLP
jgi:pimeloyl-ACP methyl ester carboxylesterase